MGERVTLHTKRLYKVVLEGYDTEVETADTFALKLSLRLSVPLPRARAVVNNLPQILRGGMTASEANKLKSILEDIRGIVHLGTHFVTPGQNHHDIDTDITAGDWERRQNEGRLQRGSSPGTILCPNCGWEEEETSSHCSICLRRFRRPAIAQRDLENRIPEVNPLEASVETGPPLDLRALWDQHRLKIIGGGALAIIVLLSLVK